jgi:zinc protease
VKRISMLLLTSALIAISIFNSSPATAQSDWQQIKIPPLPEFHPQVPKRIVFPNGMVVFLQEDHELPLIDGIARIRGGSRSEAAEKIGMIDMYGEVWRTGGTKAQTGDQLDDFLEVRAAKVETSGTVDSTTVSFSCLKNDFDDVFKVFDELLRQPEFRADKLDLAKREYFDSISRRNDDVDEIVARESAKLAYGPQNPYAREAEYKTVAAVSRQDLLDWHHAHVTPNNIIMGFVGDFDAAAIEAKLRQTYGAWAKGPALVEKKLEPTPAQPRYYLVQKEDVNQSSIEMVGLGITRDNPDYYAVRVFNEAFGGGFSSRLFRTIRTQMGLAYAVGGGVGSAFDHPGVVRLSMGTKSATTLESIRALQEQIDEVTKHPITEAEIKSAKDAILTSFIFNLDSPDKILRERMAYEFYGYSQDYLEKFRAGVEKVTQADVARAATKYLHKEKLAVLVVGNPADFDKPLSSLGSVVPIDITIPPPPGAPNQ